MASVIQKTHAGPLYYTSPEPEAGHIASFGSYRSRVGVSSSGRAIRHSRSFSSIRRISMGARSGPIMPATPPSTGTADTAVDDLPPLPSSDSKYNNQTATARSREQRRSRAQRRRTDGSDEISTIQRPSTSRASLTRKVTYSQYPDFETITDPFAKRDKIPRKSERPFLLNATDPASDGLSRRLSGRGRGTAPDVQGDDPRGGADSGNGNEYFESRSASVQNHAPSAKSLGIRPSYTQDAQLDVPTPLRKHDKIPRYAQQPQRPSLGLLADSSQSAAIDSTLQMESLDMQFPESPVTPTQSAAARVSLHNTTTVLLTASLITPVSPEHNPNTTRKTANTKDSQQALQSEQQQLQQKSTTDESASLSSSTRPFSGHNISPRLQIDMDKVDTLYARRSLLFENKMKREGNSIKSTSAVNVSQSTPARKDSIAHRSGSHATRAVANRYSDIPEEYDDDDNDAYDDKDSEDYIPFDQVLIPTAFKRLRSALEDPAFEIDEKTYRRFKLSERWYAREERLQLERTIGHATLGKTKARGRVVNKSTINDSNMPSLEGRRVSQSEPSDGNRVMHNTLDSDDLMPESIQPSVPSRKRTKSSQHSRHNLHTMHDSLLDIQKSADGCAGEVGSHRAPSSTALARSDLSAGYVPPIAPPSQAYKPDRHRTQLEHPHETSFSQMEIQDPIDDKYHLHNGNSHSRARRTNTVRSTTIQQQHQESSTCCGCTIM